MGRGLEGASRMILARPVKEHIAQPASVLQRQIPFENLHCHGGMLPGESQIRFEVGWIDDNNIFLSDNPWIRKAIATPGIPKYDRPIWTNQPQSRVIGPQQAVCNNHLELWLVRAIDDGFNVGRSTYPILRQIGRWQMEATCHRTRTKKHHYNDNDRFKASDFS